MIGSLLQAADFNFIGMSYGLPMKLKYTSCKKCAARGDEITALQTARARRLRYRARQTLFLGEMEYE